MDHRETPDCRGLERPAGQNIERDRAFICDDFVPRGGERTRQGGVLRFCMQAPSSVLERSAE